MTKRKRQGPLCPKCGGPVVRAGHARGVQRYQHGGDGKNPCRWHGTKPVQHASDQSKGIDRVAADRLYASVKTAERKRYVVTAAQNATPINKAFFASLLTYCKERRAQLIVIPYRYKNPTSMWSEKAEHDDWWASELAPHLLDRRTQLNDNLVLLSDIKTQPTATAPLQGYETISGGNSAIIGHPKIELKSVPAPQSRLPKLLLSTGAVTVKNYIESKAGKQAEHHHSFAATAVEVSGKKFHVRQLNATRNGSFIDFTTEYDGENTRHAPCEALVMGDSHVEFIDKRVAAATFGPGGLVEALKPKYLVWHDVHDFYSRNHHHRGRVFVNLVKHVTGRDDVEKMLRETFAYVDSVTPAYVRNIFVPSNHPDALARWIEETDPRQDPRNCIFWAQTFAAMAEGARWTESGASTIDPFAYWGRRWLKTSGQATFLHRGQSFTIKGIEVGFHGDKGANGARGTVKSYSRIGVKTITGHGHAPEIKDGAYRVGTNSLLALEYNTGAPSSWLHTDCTIYANGKRSLINIIDGEFRA